MEKMYNIFYKKQQDKLITAIEKPFQTEEELEKYLMNTKEIFSDIFILKRQVKAGRDIPDMIGVDRDNNIVIIENKNVMATEDVLSQILRYVIWAKTNPDSIKAMWLEAKNRPEDIDVEWDNVEVRVMILAPSIRPSVTRLLKMINCTVELIEVKRFLLGNNGELFLFNRLEEVEMKTKSARGMEIYDKEFYKQHRNNKSVDDFFRIVGKIETMVKGNNWNLEKKFNKHYMGFKAGFLNVFGVQWLGTRSFGFFFKVPHKQFLKIKGLSAYELEYDERWKQAILRYDEKIEFQKLKPIFEKVYGLFMEKS